MTQILTHPFFIIGVLIRLFFIFTVAPEVVNIWYAPFLEHSISSWSIDPWNEWVAVKGVSEAFPYGYTMWLSFIPMLTIVNLLNLPIDYAYDLTLLASDLCLLICLFKLVSNRQRLILLTFWLSPVIILASYAFGFNDLIPTLFLIIAMLCVKNARYKLAGFILAAAISAKLSMILALPFFVIYFLNNKALKKYLVNFFLFFGLSLLLFNISFVFSKAGFHMIFGSREITKVFYLTFELFDDISIFILPLFYIVTLYLTWRVQRLNYELFQATIGISFLIIIVVSPSSPGWFIWCIPFLVIYQSISDRIAIILFALFSCLFVLITLLQNPIHLLGGRILSINSNLSILEEYIIFFNSLSYTLMAAVGGILIIRIWRESFKRNDFFRLSRKPFVIGVAGDSGSGKDTFVDAISGLFGEHSVVKMSGDNYHRWDRKKPTWHVMTHLNPLANDLEGFSNDLITLVDGKSVQCKHYDHNTGKMSKAFRMKSNDFIIASGLHALYFPSLRECYNLKIYLNIDEGLRKYFKIKRDTSERGYSVNRVIESFDKRELDSEKFIKPQAKLSDLNLSLQPIHPTMLDDFKNDKSLRLKLVIESKNSHKISKIQRVLIGICGLHVDTIMNKDGVNIMLTIEGELSQEDVALAAEILCSDIKDFLDIAPKWEDGMLGLMQLITLVHISQALKKRFIK